MKIGFTTLGCPDWDLDTILSRAKEYGYHGVDFRMYQGRTNIHELPEFTEAGAETAGRFADAGIEVCAFSSGARLCSADPAKRDEHVAEVEAYGRLCKVFSTPLIRVFGGRLEGGAPEEAIRVFAETLDRMAKVAAPATVVVETHDDWLDSSLLAAAMHRTSAPNVGVLWDVHHPFRLNGESPRETYEHLAVLTRYTHIKNSRPLPDGTYQYTLPGEGDVPLEEIIGLLKSGGYDGYLTLEWEKKWHPELPEPEVAFPAYAEYLRKFV